MNNTVKIITLSSLLLCNVLHGEQPRPFTEEEAQILNKKIEQEINKKYPSLYDRINKLVNESAYIVKTTTDESNLSESDLTFNARLLHDIKKKLITLEFEHLLAMSNILHCTCFSTSKKSLFSERECNAFAASLEQYEKAFQK